MALLYRVENSGLTTYNNFTFTDSNGNVKIINLEPNEVYYASSWSIISPSSNIVVSPMTTPSFVMNFEGCCNTEQKFSFYGIEYSNQSLVAPFQAFIINRGTSFSSIYSSSNPTVTYNGCFQYVSSATTVSTTYPLSSILSVPSSFVGTNIYDNITSQNISTCQKCLLDNPCQPTTEIAYFKYCCPHPTLSTEYFGLTVPYGTVIVNSVYDVQLPSITGCSQSILQSDIPVTESYPVYDLAYTLVQYDSCSSCTATTLNCVQTPIVTPTIYYTSSTRCGETKSYRNECEPVVIFPLGVECNSIDPTNSLAFNGSISLVITGGTPPYTITWNTGASGYFLQNLPVGSYTSTVTDFYGDFTAVTTCTLTGETPTVTSTPVPTPTPTPCVNMVDNGTFDGSLSPWVPAWELGWRWSTFSGGSAEYIGADDGTHLTQPNSLIVGCTYQIDYDVYNNTNDGSGFIRPFAGTTGTGYGYQPLGWSHQTFTLICEGNGDFYLTGYFGGTGSLFVDNVVICQIECGTPPLPQNRYCYHIYIKKNGSVYLDVNIVLFLSDDINGHQSWTSIDGEYILSWSSTLNGWQITSVSNLFGCTIFNSSTDNPPLNSFTFYGADVDSYVRGNIGGCENTTLCANIVSSCGTENITMSTGGTMSGEIFYSGNKPCGDSGIWYILYNPQNSRWETSGLTSVYGFTSEAWSNTSVFNLNWTDSNGYSLQTYSGPCGNSSQMNLMTTPTNPTGPSNGVISMNVSGGIGPYTYSVDGGVTFSPFPIFNNLTPGTYNVVAKDSNGNTVTDTVTLVGANTTTYSVGLITTTATLLNSPVRQTKQYTSVIRVIPSLPDGAVLNFDLVHVNSSNSSPYYNSAIVTTNSVLTKNSTTVPINSTSTNTGTTINTLTACQNQFTYYTGMTDLWSSVSYNNTTTLQLVTTTTVFQNTAVKCYIGTSVDTFTITNLSISGCSGCNAVILV